MKRSALNHIYKIMNETVEGCVQPESFPERCLESIEDMEMTLDASIKRCEERKKDYNKSYYRVESENQSEIQNVIYGLSKRGINIPLWCLLLMCAIHELDNDALSLRGRVDQLEAENKELKGKLLSSKKELISIVK